MQQKESTWNEELNKFQENPAFLNSENTELRKNILDLRNKLTEQQEKLPGRENPNDDELKKLYAWDAVLEATRRFFAKINAAMVAPLGKGAPNTKPKVMDKEAVLEACAEYGSELTLPKLSFTPREYASLVAKAVLIGAATAAFTFLLRVLALYALCHMPVIGPAVTAWAVPLLAVSAFFSYREGMNTTENILKRAEYLSFKESCYLALSDVPLVNFFMAGFAHLKEGFKALFSSGSSGSSDPSEKSTTLPAVETSDNASMPLTGDFAEERMLGLKVMEGIQATMLASNPELQTDSRAEYQSLFAVLSDVFAQLARGPSPNANQNAGNQSPK